MQWVDRNPALQSVTQVRYRLDDGRAVLTWNWPEGVQFVYIYAFEPGTELPAAGRPASSMKLYTREEYKAKGGYYDRIESIGLKGYRIYACTREDGEIVGLRQEDEENLVQFSTGKAKIFYSIKYRPQLFGKNKAVRIQLVNDIFVPKEALCYVKREGVPPLQKTDGTLYPFIGDFKPGRNMLPEIEIRKNEFIKLFFTDGKTYGEMFDLIPE